MSITIFKKNLADSMFGAPVELRAHEGWVQWRAADSSEAWANLFEIPQDGADGADGLQGLPGANGTPVELQVSDDMLQWRYVGGEDWTDLIDLGGLAGADGRAVEMQSVISDDGMCQTLQWRLAGDTEWIDLATTPVCDTNPAPALKNSAQNRCGVAVAVTSALGTYYRRVKLDPDAWDELQYLAGQAAAGGTTVSIAAGALGTVLGAGAVLSGVGLIGGAVAGAGAFLGGILALTNDNDDAFSPSVADDLSEGLYCVLSRQETTQITAAVLREWISYIADAGMPDADRDIVLGILAMTPLQYWQNEATVAQPKINPCATSTCANRDIEFSYEFTAEPVPGKIQFLKPLAAALMQLTTGERDIRGIAAAPAPLNTRTFSVTIHLGRIVPVSGIELEVFYNQTANVTSPVLTLFAENILVTETVTGVAENFATIRWKGLEFIDRFTVSGIVGTNGDFDDEAYLELYRLKVCGIGWPSWGQDADTGEPCEYDPCMDGPDYGTDHCYTWDFTQSTGNWSLALADGVAGTWENGVGWKSTLRVQGADRTDELRIGRGFTADFNRRLKRIEIEGEFTRGQIQFGGTLGRGEFVLRDTAASSTLFYRNVSFNGVEVTTQDSPFRSNMTLVAIGSQRTSATPSPRGNVVIRRISVWYDGVDAEFTGGSGS